MTHAEVLSIAGPVGPLEAKLEFPDSPGPGEGAARVFGVACHPHPLYGGTMDNKVTHVLARAMMECGAPTFRFNFRGAGASGGSFDNGRGEADDLVAVVAEGRRRFPDADLWLGGFSFGAFVALRAAQALGPAKLVAVAPPVARFELGSVAHPECDWMLAQGDADEVVPPEAVLAWAAEQHRKPRLHVLAGAGHFFHGKLHELKPLVIAFLKS
ncbi:MAG TPA: alpha/beta fold hydrolase [Steroidobacteraceae bacterium]|nr:alpha/beta fold hydrolase [Steroidobacteraceae bacterium]